MKITGIYKIENKINGKVYIGQSIDIIRRWKEHCRPSKIQNGKLKIERAFFKYGVHNFSFEVLETCPIECLYEIELKYIRHYQSFKKNIGYNIVEGGQGGYGKKHSDEQKAKWSEMRKKMPMSEGFRKANEENYEKRKKPIVRISENDELKFYGSISDADTRQDGNIWRAINRWKKTTRSNWSHGYYWMLLEDYNEFGIVKQSNSRKIKANIEIKLTHFETNEVLIFKSKREAYDFLKVKHPTFNSKIGKVYKDYLIELIEIQQ
jgi:group I intron endonuclease